MKMLVSTHGHEAYSRASSARVAWWIAWRQIREGLRSRSTWILTLATTAVPLIFLYLSLRQALQDVRSIHNGSVGVQMAFYLLWLGLVTTLPALGIAAGAFAGEKENGSLAPLLVTPASNLAIFAGKIMGAVVGALGTSLLGIILYLLEVGLGFGWQTLTLLPVALSLLMILLIPAIAFFGAGLASLISSRAKTFQAAQNYGSLILTLLWAGLIVLVVLFGALGIWGFAITVVVLYALDSLLIVFGASTWRREEVLARQ
jgi:ABC-2 type transport system permease protein